MMVDGDEESSAETDMELSDRLQKRMKLTDPIVSEAFDHYGAVNGLLGSLHAQRARRLRQEEPVENVVRMEDAAVPRGSGRTASSSCGSVDVEKWTSRTSFTLADVVSCSHGPGGRCLQCAGRGVQDVPVDVYCAYCRAYQSVDYISHPDPSEAARYSVPARSLVAGEICFPSFSALLADAGFLRDNERFLDLGSGAGRAVVAFALLYPSATAAGIEIRPALHEVACGVMARLSIDVQQRVSLHCGDMFQCSWAEATMLFVNSTGFDETLMANVLERLRALPAGTRAITLSQPLPTAGLGLNSREDFELLLQAKYKMTWGNATAYVYKRL